MSSLQPQSQVISLEQYEALPEDVRAEVFDGQLYYMASPSQEHQTISIELLTYLSG
nr:Uma2 family endonuclease [uncultured Acetatifactor sp.]